MASSPTLMILESAVLPPVDGVGRGMGERCVYFLFPAQQTSGRRAGSPTLFRSQGQLIYNSHIQGQLYCAAQVQDLLS